MRQRKLPIGTRNLIGQRIKTLRMKRGMSQAGLLSKLELSGHAMDQSRLSNIEGQRTIVTDYELVALSNALQIPVSELLPGTEAQQTATIFGD